MNVLKIVGGKMVFAFAFIGAALCASAVPTVTIDSVTQRWPWNNKVDIKYRIAGGTDMSAHEYYKIKFTATIDGQEYVIDGSRDIIATTLDGTHTVTWTNAPSGVKASGCTMGATMYATTGDYMIIDLDSGHMALEDMEEGDTRTASPTGANARYNTPLYKTDRLVLRRVERTTASGAAYASYRTGHADYDASTYTYTGTGSYTNSVKDWTTDKDFYAGVFMVTVAQYQKIMGVERAWSFRAFGPNVKDWCPASAPSYNTLRNSKPATTALSADATGVSFFERLNAKTGVGTGFDLPTEVMWEIATRAGTTSRYWWGPTAEADILNFCVVWSGERVADPNNANNKTWGWSVGLRKDGTKRRRANNWGLCDTIGNLYEPCRDVGYYGDLKDAADPFTPKYDSGVNKLMLRGGYWEGGSTQNYWESSFRKVSNYTLDGGAGQYIGLRVFFVAP